MDENGDGFISAAEMKNVLIKHFHENPSDADAEEMIKRWGDEMGNKDGKINYEEWLNYQLST